MLWQAAEPSEGVGGLSVTFGVTFPPPFGRGVFVCSRGSHYALSIINYELKSIADPAPSPAPAWVGNLFPCFPRNPRQKDNLLLGGGNAKVWDKK